MKSAGTYRERGQLAFAQIHILESRELLLSSFATALRERVGEDIAAQERAPSRPGETTDWQSISLVDEGQIEEKISFERIGQLIAHRSETELRELDGFMSGMLRHGWADPARNPAARLDPRLGAARAIEKVTDEPDTQKIFARELGQAMASAMPACYREIVADLKRRARSGRPISRCARSTMPRRARRRVRAAGRHRLRGSAQGLGAVVDRPDGSGDRSAAAQLGGVDPRPLQPRRSVPMRSTPRARPRCSIG